MSMVEKMSISGIRSFGPERHEKQEIKFNSPVTLILGANGCGKTTIIECLKFALTGELPPGSGQGRSFVHDPKVLRKMESLGQVKLQVRNIHGKHLTITRNVKTSVVNKKVSFKNMNVLLHVVDTDGTVADITNRCADGTEEMCNAMGVSKAIINNVIFCHQEDSNWPLDEPKKLKEKFDAIFGTTEYNRAIDKILKIRKNFVDDQKTKEADLKISLFHKNQAESKQLSLKGAEEKQNKLLEEKNQLEVELNPILERLQKIEEKEGFLSRFIRDKIELSANLNNCREQQESLRRKIKKLFDGSTEFLEIEINSFRSDMVIKKENLSGHNIEMNRLKANEKRINSKITELEKKRTTLSFQRQQEQELLGDRAEKLKDLSTRLNILSESNTNDFETNSQSIVDVTTQIKKKLKIDEKDVQDMSKEHEITDKNLQKQIDKFRESKAHVENEIGSKKRQVETVQREESELKAEIRSVELSAQKSKTLNDKIIELDQMLDKCKQTYNLDEMRSKITEKKENRERLQEKLDKIDDDITHLNSIAKLSVEIDSKEKHLESRETEAKRIKAKHSEGFKVLFGNGRSVESNYKREVENIRMTVVKTINDLKAEIKNNELQTTKFSTMRVNHQNELKRFQKELADGEEKIYDLCGASSFTEHLEKKKERLDKTQSDYGAFKSSDILYKRYINLMEADPCCPLCHKVMSSNEVGTLSSELSDEIQLMPDKIARTEKELKDLTKEYETLLTLKPLTENIEKMKINIPKVEAELKNCKDKLSNFQSEKESLQMALIEPEHKLQQIEIMIGDMSLLDVALRDIESCSREITVLRAKLPAGRSTSTMNLADAQMEKSTIAGELKSERKDIESLEKTYEQQMNKINELREIRNKVKDEQIKLAVGIQNLPQLKLRLETLSKQIETHLDERRILEQKLPPLVREMNEAIRSKEETRVKNRETLSAAQNRLTEIRNILGSVEKINQQLSDLETLNIAEEIENVKGDLKKYADEQKSITTLTDELSKKIEKVKDEISSHELLERDLLDNRDLKKMESEEKVIQQKLDKVNHDIGETDQKSMSKLKNELCKKQDTINSKRSRLSGQIGELQNQIDNMRKELNQTEYKNSVANYRNAMYQVEATKAILHDLKEYRAALECALMKFHSEKMRKINELIREYWRSIYRGNDIDYVEIKTEESKTNSDIRRNYNYRVVQSKNETELDMRGQCSAGQRVLACLIIRIALAETFSANCGVLALDEPTTNLDRENILSLCEMLTRVIEERQGQSNFMMIVITHDEEFVNTMGNINSFYKLSRSNEGKSIITKVRAQ